MKLVVLISVENSIICLYWILTPKCSTQILFDLQTEHIFDKASYYEDDKSNWMENVEGVVF